MYYLLSVFLFCKVQDWVVEPPQIEGTPVAKVENDEEDGEDNQESDVGFGVVVSPTVGSIGYGHYRLNSYFLLAFCKHTIALKSKPMIPSG